MKFSCNQQTLTKALNIVSKAVTIRTTIPILKGILLKIDDNGVLTMSASDLDLSIEKKIKVENSQPGEIVVLSKLFGDIIRKLPDGIITIEEAKGTETYIQVNEGIQFNTGFLSPYFITDRDKSTCILESPRVLLYTSKMASLKDFYTVLEQIMTRKESVLIVASDYDVMKGAWHNA